MQSPLNLWDQITLIVRYTRYNTMWSCSYYYKYNQWSSPRKSWVRTSFMTSCTRYNIINNISVIWRWSVLLGGHSRTAFFNISMSSCFPRFIVRLILNFIDQPTHENHENWYPTNKSDFTVGASKCCIDLFSIWSITPLLQ
jgi:hypothetical protein